MPRQPNRKYDPSLTHKDLVRRAELWLRSHWRCATALTECPTWVGGLESPDAIGWVRNGCIVVECKTSVADFRADKKKLSRKEDHFALGNLRFFLTEKGLLDGEELPAGWGLYEVCGRSVKYNRGVKDTDPIQFKETGGWPFLQSTYAYHAQIYILRWMVVNRKG